MKTLSRNQMRAVIFICFMGAALAVAVPLLMNFREGRRLTQLNAKCKPKYELLHPKVSAIEELADARSFLDGIPVKVMIVKTDTNPFLPYKDLQEPLDKGLRAKLVPGYYFSTSALTVGKCSLAKALDKDKLNRYCAIIDSLTKRAMQNIYLIAPRMYQIVLSKAWEDIIPVNIDEEIDSTTAEVLTEEIIEYLTQKKNDIIEDKGSRILQGMEDVIDLINSHRKDLIEIVDHPDQIKFLLDSISDVSGSSSYGANAQSMQQDPTQARKAP